MTWLAHPLVIVAAIVCVPLGLLAYLAWRQKRAESRFFERLASLGGVGSGAAYVFESGGNRFRTQYHAGSKNSPSRFSLIADVSSPGGVQIMAEGAIDRFFEGLGVEGKISTGDPRIDGRLHVSTDDEEFASSYLASAERRGAIVALFDCGFTQIELDETAIKISRSPFKVGDDVGVEFIKIGVANLSALIERLPAVQPGLERSGMTRKKFNAIIGSMGVLLIAAFVFVQVLVGARGLPLDGYGLFLTSLVWSGSAFAALCLVLFRLLKGKTWFGQIAVQLLFWALIFFPLLGYYAARWANYRFDPSAPSNHAVAIINKWTTRSKSTTFYHVRVRSWRPDRVSESLDVSRSAYGGVSNGAWAVVTTKPGYLGHEWIVNIDLSASVPEKY